ncbi:serine hydrolase domain-containing protein [Marinoscillum sp.]|uniref:serine hydrolase domain-containing protein n=1 Tax=Marinoscillum sp. TaxID=2024838 RepID=UPI003BAC5E67
MKSLVITFLVLVICSNISAQSLTEEQISSLDKLITGQLSEDLAPGLGVGIVKNGSVVYQKIIGYSDLQDSIKLSSTTSRFNYASCAKQFTALMVLDLAEKGLLDLQDDFRWYLPAYFPTIKDTITITQLITHTSGIRDIYDLWSIQGITWWQESLSNEDVLDLIKNQNSLNFQPGSAYRYSNTNYILLTELVEAICKQPFTQYSQSFFHQIGMAQTSFESNHEFIIDRVKPYGFWKGYTEYPWNSDIIGDGALFTTLHDQLLWEQTLQITQSDRLSSGTLSRSQSPILSDIAYGFGVEFEGEKTYHQGSTGAYGSFFVRVPTENISIVVMTNYSNINVSSIAEDIYQIASKGKLKERTIQTEPTTVGEFISKEEVVGTYKTSGTFYFKFFIEEDTLYLDRTYRDPVALTHERGNIYHEISDPAFKQEFKRTESGQMTVTAYYTSHDPYTLFMEESPDAFQPDRLLGTYSNEELKLSFTLSLDDERKLTCSWNGETISSELFTPALLLIGSRQFSIPKHISDLLILNTSRNSNIQFRRN